MCRKQRGHTAGRWPSKKALSFGRPPKPNAEQIELSQRLLAEGISIRAAARILNCHHSTLYRAIGILAPMSDDSLISAKNQR